jgi:hypothetical protein
MRGKRETRECDARKTEGAWAFRPMKSEPAKETRALAPDVFIALNTGSGASASPASPFR